MFTANQTSTVNGVASNRDQLAKQAAMSEKSCGGEIRGGAILGAGMDATCNSEEVRSRASGDLVHLLHSLISQSMHISDRIEGMRERALGSWPCDPKKEEARPSPSGSVGNIFNLCEMLNAVFNVQRTHLEALERVL